MFSKLLKSLLFKISTRISIVYSLVLIVGFFFIFIGIYLNVQSAYNSDYGSFLHENLKQYQASINELGLEKTKEFYQFVYRHNSFERFATFYVDSSGNAQYISVPPDGFLGLPTADDLKAVVLLQGKNDFNFEFNGPTKNGAFDITGKIGNDNSYYALISEGNYVKERMYNFGFSTLKYLVPTVLVLLLLGAYFVNFLTRPLRDILTSIKSLENGSLSTRIPLSGTTDEIEEIKDHFNSLLNKIESLVNGLKEAFDNLAHDIRTPVTRLRGRAEITLNDDNSDLETYKDALQTCFENSDKILSFLQTLTDITEAENRSRELRIKKIYISDLIREMVDLYEMSFEDKDIKLLQKLDKNDWAMIDSKLISRVIANLLDNAHKFSPTGSSVVIETINSIEHVIIRVTDEGVGIAQEEQALVFDRLYRSDKSRSEHGMGLGLAFVKAVVSAHDGKVSVKSPVKDNRGTQFEILLYKMR